MQLILIFHTQILNLLNFHKIQRNQFLVKSQYVSNRSTNFDICNLRVANFLHFKEMAEDIINYNCSSDTPKNQLIVFYA